MTLAQPFEGGDHLVTSSQLGRASIGAKLPLAREPHDDDGGQDAEDHLQHEHSRHIGQTAHPGTLFLVIGTQEIADEASHQARKEDDKGIHHPLDQGQGDHVTVGDVTHLMRQNRLGLIPAHAVQQTRADRHQRIVTAGPRGKGIHLG